MDNCKSYPENTVDESLTSFKVNSVCGSDFMDKDPERESALATVQEQGDTRLRGHSDNLPIEPLSSIASTPSKERRRSAVDMFNIVKEAVRTINRRSSHRNMQTLDGEDFDEAVVLRDSTFEPLCNHVFNRLLLQGGLRQEDHDFLLLLQSTEHFHLLSKEDLKRVIAASLRREYVANEIIFREGDRVPHVGIVMWGHVEGFAPTSWSDPPTDRWVRSRHQSVFSLPSDEIGEERSSCLETRMEPESPAGVVQVHCGTLMPGMLFGVDSCVFEEPTSSRYRAGNATQKVTVAYVPHALVRELLKVSPRFSLSVGRQIAEQDIFIPVREFCRYVFSPTTAKNEYLPLWTILEKYIRIDNVIHTKVASRELDTAAWGYALKRLPENVTSTFCFDLAFALPAFVATRMREEAKRADGSKTGEQVSSTRTSVSFIRTKERRRCTWLLGMEGKSLVLLRDGYTDLLDFLSMLCVHIIESNKLRSRVQGMVHPPAIDILNEYLRQRDADKKANVERTREQELQKIQEILARMPLSPAEQAGLLNNWHTKCLVLIYEVMMHREEFNVRVDSSISRKFQLNPFHEWALNLRACIMGKIGLDRNSPIPEDLCIDVVSSNTHCIKNLLSRFHRQYWNEIMEHAKTLKAYSDISQWYVDEDVLYSATTSFLTNARPDLKEEYIQCLDESGITVLTDTAMTGLQVDVIPVHGLNFEYIDTVVRESIRKNVSESKPGAWQNFCLPHKGQPSRRTTSQSTSPNDSQFCHRLQQHIIINMDFAFGAQAEGICKAIFNVFGCRIRSVNVIGKAGGLVGKRGDIQLPTHVLLSKSSLIVEGAQDELRRCRNQGFTADRLRELVGPHVDVHEGKLLTIAGTLLQNKRMLRFYKHVMGCVGAEMEGSYFARVIEDLYRQGISVDDLVSRFAYYTSDLPLGTSAKGEDRGGSSLSAPLAPREGVPPLYAIARGVLELILRPSHRKSKSEK